MVGGPVDQEGVVEAFSGSMKDLSRQPIHGCCSGQRERMPGATAMLRLMLVSGLMGFLLVGCDGGGGGEERVTRLESGLYASVEVLGGRGVGLGQFNKPRSVLVDRMDRFYVVDMTGRVQRFSSSGHFDLFWQMPQTDLGKPKGLGLDVDGNIVVVEPHYSRFNHHSVDGTLLRQWGERGTADGQLVQPRAVAVNSRGELYVAEFGGRERVQRFNATGKVLLGLWGGPGDGPSQFNRPEGIAVDGKDRVLVADSCNHRVQVFSTEGTYLREFGRAGSGRGEMSYPYDVKIDLEGRIYVCEFGNNRVQVFSESGASLEVIGRGGAGPGELNNPWGLALDSKGNLYVADSGNHRIQRFERRRT